MIRFSHILEFFGLRRSTIGMLFMVILVGMGERMAERFLPIYLIAIGGSVLSIGLLNGLDNLYQLFMPIQGVIFPIESAPNEPFLFSTSLP